MSTDRAKKMPHDWSQLPGQLLERIISRLIKLADFHRFQAVCKPWRKAILGQHEEHKCPQFRQSLPWLVRPPSRRGNSLMFKDVAEHRFVFFEFTVVDRRMLRSSRGSSFGWLFMAQQSSPYLLNPVTKRSISLHPIPGGGDIWAFVMSAEPTATEGCVVMIFYYREQRTAELAFCKLGDNQQWRLVPKPEEENYHINDIVFWRNRFYAISSAGRIFVCDLNEPHGKPMMSRAFIPKVPATIGHHPRKIYLVTGPEGELMLVTRTDAFRACEIFDEYYTITFRVYKMDEDEKTWDEVDSMDDCLLFADRYKVISVSSKDHPKCHKNCVYYKESRYDFGRGYIRVNISNSDEVLILPSYY